jgi:hypothetical protein
MDERGVGGTYMIQQQFLNMYHRIQVAQKAVDTSPPATSMFRRPYFSQFGGYWKRITPAKIAATGKVDCKEPDSFPLLRDLYINQKPAKEYVPAGGKHAHKAHAKHRRSGRALVSKDQERAERLNVEFVEGLATEGLPDSLVEYLVSIKERREEVDNELQSIRKRRLLRHEGTGVGAVAQSALAEMTSNTEASNRVTSEGDEAAEQKPAEEAGLLQTLGSLVLRGPGIDSEGFSPRRSPLRKPAKDAKGKYGPELPAELLAAAAKKKVSSGSPRRRSIVGLDVSSPHSGTNPSHVPRPPPHSAEKSALFKAGGAFTTSDIYSPAVPEVAAFKKSSKRRPVHMLYAYEEGEDPVNADSHWL